MADPLSQLRQFHINGREIKEHNGYIIFGDHGWPKIVNTNYQIYSTDNDKSKKEYYTLECLLYFIKNMDVAHHHYVKQAGRDNIPCVHRPDRKNLLAYLKGEQQTSSGIDKNAPIPPLRLPVADIYKKDHHNSASDSSHNLGSQLSSHSSQQDGQNRSIDPNSSGAKKRHDPELEKKFREEFAARLYAEPSNKKLASESVDKGSETAETSAAISKFGAEKLAAMRAKHLAAKQRTIVDADADVKPTGVAGDSSNREAELLIAMDSDPSRLIKSKEKVWRTRSSILQAQSKNFSKTVLPFVELIAKMDDPNRKQGNQNPPTIANDIQMNAYPPSSHPQPPPSHHPQPPSQQMQQRNTYNRYDQERFVKLDIGVEIDTKKSFVSGVASNGISSYSQQRPPGVAQSATANPRGGPPPPPSSTHGSGPPGWHPSGNNGSVPRPMDVVDRGSSQHHHSSSRPQPRKRQSTVPIIIIPNIPTSIININNALALLQDLNYVTGADNGVRAEETLIQRKKPDGTHAAYKILTNPIKLEADDWNRVVAVFVHGPAWQFKGWPWGGSPVEIFSRIKGFHLKWDEARLDDNVAKWNVHILELSKTKRHLDKASLLKFWSTLDQFMIKYKSGYLKF